MKTKQAAAFDMVSPDRAPLAFADAVSAALESRGFSTIRPGVVPHLDFVRETPKVRQKACFEIEQGKAAGESRGRQLTVYIELKTVAPWRTLKLFLYKSAPEEKITEEINHTVDTCIKIMEMFREEESIRRFVEAQGHYYEGSEELGVFRDVSALSLIGE